MILARRYRDATSERIPRESGDDPSQRKCWEEREEYSPRERG